jgi:hypothetical protein
VQAVALTAMPTACFPARYLKGRHTRNDFIAI